MNCAQVSSTLRMCGIAISAVFIGAGCATYVPPTLPQDQLARVKEYRASKTVGGYSVDIESIDGKRVRSGMRNNLGSLPWASPKAESFEVAQGNHTLKVRRKAGAVATVMFGSSAGAPMYGSVSFSAEPGMTYYVDAPSGQGRGFDWRNGFGGKLQSFVMNEKTGEVVANSYADRTTTIPTNPPARTTGARDAKETENLTVGPSVNAK